MVDPNPNFKPVNLTALLAEQARQSLPPKLKPKVEPKTAWERILEDDF